MEALLVHNIKSQVVWSDFVSKDSLLFITTLKQLKSIDTTSGNIGLSVKIEDIDLDYLNAITHFQNHSIIAYPNLEGGYVFYDYVEKKVTKTIEDIGDKATASTTDSKNRFFCIGFESGKSEIFLYKDLSPFNSPPSHTDSVVHCEFYGDGKYFITCGLDGKITISDLDSYKAPFRAKLSEKRVAFARKIDEKTMLVVEGRDTLIFFDTIERRVIKRVTLKFIKSLIALPPLERLNLLFYIKDDRKIGVINLENREIITDSLIEESSDILSVNIGKEDMITMFLRRGELQIFKLFDVSDLNSAIDNEEFKRAYDIVAKNPLLQNSDAYPKLERIWSDRFEKAFTLFCKEQEDEALNIISPFMGIPHKQGIIQRMEKEFESYSDLLSFIKDKNYVRVYSLIQGKEFLSKTPVFLNLEKLWLESYKKAQDYILKSADTPRARAVLEDFYSVPQKRQLIHNLLRNPTLFIELKSAIKNRSFYEFFSIVAKNKFLKESPEYKSVIEYGDKLHSAIKRKLKNRIFTNILSEIEELEAFPEFEDEITELKEFSKIATEFLRSFEVKNLPKCFELIDTHPILNGFSEAKSLELEWRGELQKAQNFALKGDIPGVTSILFKYLNIKTRLSAIGFIIKKTYIFQLKKALAKEEGDINSWEYAINKFLAIFGYDDEIETVLKRLKERGVVLLISKKKLEKAPGTHWYSHTKGNIPINIFERYDG